MTTSGHYATEQWVNPWLLSQGKNFIEADASIVAHWPEGVVLDFEGEEVFVDNEDLSLISLYAIWGRTIGASVNVKMRSRAFRRT